MARKNPPPSDIQTPADEIEAAFYDALQRADIDQLMACWSDEDEIVCVHPGGPRVVGPVAIRATFEAMFARGGIQARPERVRKLETVGSSVHHLIERVQVPAAGGVREAWVIATNVYHRTTQGWRLVAHHASPGTSSDIQEIVGTPQVLH